MIQQLYIIVLFFAITGCKPNHNADPISAALNADTLKKAEIIRRPTLFDKKDTSTRVGKCYKKINDNISYFVEVEPTDTVTEWLLPFAVKNRTDIKQIKVVSLFGAGRTSHLRGHKHTGADIVPTNMDTGVYIYPVAKGIVCFKVIKDPFSSITIKHRLSDSSHVFTSYIHLKEIYVANGDTVDTNTKVGKLFTHKEVRRYRGPFDHLHLEVRKNFDDFGFASSHCMNKSEVDSFFYEPINFLSKKIKFTVVKPITTIAKAKK